VDSEVLLMQSTKSAGYIELSFDEWDWKLGDGSVVLDFIKEMKASIPPEDRSYNPETKIWTIKERWQYVLRELKGKYFEDPNQIDIF
jgi:hypothetical protein